MTLRGIGLQNLECFPFSVVCVQIQDYKKLLSAEYELFLLLWFLLLSNTREPLVACLMALAHKPGGGDESCRTNRKLFALTATSPRPRLKENRAGECATALANGITTEHKPGNNAVTRTDKRTDELRASDFCRSGAFAASRRRSASLGRKAATTTTTQLWQREAGLYICLFLSRRNDLDYRRNGAAAALLHDTGRRRSIWGFLQRERAKLSLVA